MRIATQLPSRHLYGSDRTLLKRKRREAGIRRLPEVQRRQRNGTFMGIVGSPYHGGWRTHSRHGVTPGHHGAASRRRGGTARAAQHGTAACAAKPWKNRLPLRVLVAQNAPRWPISADATPRTLLGSPRGFAMPLLHRATLLLPLLAWATLCPALAIANDPRLPALTEPEQTEAPSVYAARRAALMNQMATGVAVVYASGEEDGDGYRQSSDFYYLTGVVEAGAVLVLAPRERTYKEFLILAHRDPEAERWTGAREPISDALRARYGFERIYRTDRLASLLLDLATRSPTLWQVSRPSADAKPADLELYGQISAKLPGIAIKTLAWALPIQRSRHSDDELALMQHAVRISEAGFAAAAPQIHPGAFEGSVEAEAERVFKSSGARRPAYPSIVGSGGNSTILHYPRSERTMADGDLILMDMAAEYAHYAADITRTFPVNGHFSPEQRRVYDIVLAAQKAAFAKVKPGVYFEDLDREARRVVREAGYGDYFIHGLGHFVGLDVHDAGAYQEPLEAGMVITLEPGIYIPEKKLGVRIEDDVLVTPTGAKLLSDGLPREPDAVESWLQAHGGAGAAGH
jgi:Xaa-Pro aminopeptidase